MNIAATMSSGFTDAPMLIAIVAVAAVVARIAPLYRAVERMWSSAIAGSSSP
jgi:hypothetical protein